MAGWSGGFGGFLAWCPRSGSWFVAAGTVVDVLEAIRAAACHATACFEVEDVEVPSWLPTCSSRAAGESARGEVRVFSAQTSI